MRAEELPPIHTRSLLFLKFYLLVHEGEYGEYFLSSRISHSWGNKLNIVTTCSPPWDASKGPMLDDRYRHRTLFNTCGVDILWFGTVRELFHGVICAVIGERSLISYDSF
jgi:hypothetical protein